VTAWLRLAALFVLCSGFAPCPLDALAVLIANPHEGRVKRSPAAALLPLL
jgi:hypothetical protein